MRSFGGSSLGYWVKNVVLFFFHVGSWTLWTLLIRSSRTGSDYSYDFVGVVLLTEVAKFVLSFFFHFSTISPQNYLTEIGVIVSQWRMGIYFAVPALIYGIYNSLFFLNLTFFDPVSYRVLINIRILWSGVLFQIFFSKQLGLMKWLGLVTLMFGCAVNQFDENFRLSAEPLHIAALMFQAFTSSFGGVYSEFLLKKNHEISLNVKNMYLYFFSIVFYFVFIVFTRPQLLLASNYTAGYTPTVYLCIFVGAFCGFSTSLFLKHLNIIMKEYAHSGEMFLTAVLTAMLFHEDVSSRVWVSVVLVSVSIVLYNRHSDSPQPSSKDDSSDDKLGHGHHTHGHEASRTNLSDTTSFPHKNAV